MIDFIKAEVININPMRLMDNKKLEFKTQLNYETGEFGSHCYAYYKGLKFKIYNRTDHSNKERIYLEGSLHKFYNDGKHNFNIFNLKSLQDVMRELRLSFGIKPKHLRLLQMEIGVNITPPVETIEILKCCLLHSTKQFKWTNTKTEGNYIQAEHSNFFIKIYDKRKQYSKEYTLHSEILRFEIKAKGYKLRHMFGRKKALTMQYILDYGIKKFTSIIDEEWLKILFFDKPALQNHVNYYAYSNQIYWINLKPDNLKYHRNKMNAISNQSINSLRKRVGFLISNTMSQLINNTTENHPSIIGSKWAA